MKRDALVGAQRRRCVLFCAVVLSLLSAPAALLAQNVDVNVVSPLSLTPLPGPMALANYDVGKWQGSASYSLACTLPSTSLAATALATETAPEATISVGLVPASFSPPGGPLTLTVDVQDVPTLAAGDYDVATVYVYEDWSGGLRRASAVPPLHVAASDGTVVGQVHVTWDDKDSAAKTALQPFVPTLYAIYRAATLTGPKELVGDWQAATTFDDTTAAPGAVYYYWVRAKVAYSALEPYKTNYSTPDAGWAPAVTLTTSSSAGGAVTTPGEGAYPYTPGAVVTVEATADPHFHFTTWTGTAVTAGKVADVNAASTSVTMDADYTLQANFAIDQHTIAVSCSAGGSVVSPGVGTFTCDYGTLVTLQAQTLPTFEWAGWTGSIFDTRSTTFFTVDADHHVRATFRSLLDTLYVDARAANDTEADGTARRPLGSIQAAIEVARAGTRILVRPGLYREQLDLMGKNVTVQGLWLSDPNVKEMPIVDANGAGPVVSFWGRENNTCILAGLQIQGGYGNDGAAALNCRGAPVIENCLIVHNDVTGFRGSVIRCQDSRALFVNCTIVDNTVQGEAALIECTDSELTLSNSIVWANTSTKVRVPSGASPTITYCDFEGRSLGAGNLNVDPQFNRLGVWVDPNEEEHGHHHHHGPLVWVPGDYHLRSQTGRFDPAAGVWALDHTTSPCIDAGDPGASVGAEPAPNGDRVNLGVYGGTSQASLSDKK